MLRQDGLNELIERIERDGKHRVLHQLYIPDGRTSTPHYGDETFIGIVVDVETTGLDVQKDAIIELAVRRFRYDRHGRILKIDRSHSWREDPGQPLESKIVQLTGLSNKQLAGCEIDASSAVRLLVSAHLIIAHNAAFDRKFVEKRLPDAAGLAWCCTCAEIDWSDFGLEGRKLGWLAAQAGWFFGAHRADNDVDAVIALLQFAAPDGRTVLCDLVDSAGCPSVQIDAVGASFDVKDTLRLRGYRWISTLQVWRREVAARDLPAEEAWLARNIYAGGFGARASGPQLTELTARERYT